MQLYSPMAQVNICILVYKYLNLYTSIYLLDYSDNEMNWHRIKIYRVFTLVCSTDINVS